MARSLPALMRSEKVQHKAAKTGFEWPDISGALAKVEEELDEVKRALQGDGNVQEEIGDLLFATVKLARFADTDPEEALNHTTEKFIHRFSYVEQGAAQQGRQIQDLTLKEMIELWNQGKAHEKG